MMRNYANTNPRINGSSFADYVDIKGNKKKNTKAVHILCTTDGQANLTQQMHNDDQWKRKTIFSEIRYNAY